MRSRKSRGLDGLPHGSRNSNGKGRRRTHWRTLLKLGAATVLMTWVTAVICRRGATSPSGHTSGWGLSRLWDAASGDDSYLTKSSELAASAKHEHKHKHKKHKHSKAANDLPLCTPSPLEKRQTYPMYGCDEMEEMMKGETTFMGEGYWREVRLAVYNGQEVAIKTLKGTQEETRRNKERHRWEAAALDAVKDHPNIVHLLGLCESDMITEYFPVYMDELLLGDSVDEPEAISDGEVIRMALEAARGLQALHDIPGGPVVHADLQPRQLLLDKDGVVKVNDLNRCRFMGRDMAGHPCPFKISRGNGVWRSPEEYAEEPLTEKLDIYSMGNIFWAMFGREAPFPRDETYKARVIGGERPFVDPSWHPGFVQLFQDMWKRDPAERPDAGEVVARLEQMMAELPARRERLRR